MSLCALMLNAGASTPNPRVLQFTTNLVSAAITSGGSIAPLLCFIYVVDGVVQTVQSSTVNVVNQGITWPDFTPGYFAGTAAFGGQATYQLFIPQGTLPATAGQSGAGARLYMFLYNAAPLTGGSFVLDVTFSEVPFRPFDWDVPANSISSMFVPKKWRQQLPLVDNVGDLSDEKKVEDLDDPPSPGVHQDALTPLVVNQESPVLVSSSASKSRRPARLP